MPKGEKKTSDERLAFLADRMAILMVVCQARTGSWDPWFREALYEDPEAMGDEIRSWVQHKTALDVIRNMMRKHDEMVSKSSAHS